MDKDFKNLQRRLNRLRPEVKEREKKYRKNYLSKPEVREKIRKYDNERYKKSDKRRLQKHESTKRIRATLEGKIKRSIIESRIYAKKMGHCPVDPDTVKIPHEDGLCDFCGNPPGKRRLCLDHCHETGRFRGWLCDKCNTAFGRFGDNVEGFERAIEYLKNGRPVSQGGALRLK